jgi:hypothetical protein
MDEFQYMPVTKLPSGLMLPENDMIDEEALYRDQEYLKQMYPARARLILALVEDRCDRMEYEGSPMFADYPDKESFLRVARDIFKMVSGDSQNQDEEANAILKQLIEILVLNECSMRRGRYRRRRRFFA